MHTNLLNSFWKLSILSKITSREVYRRILLTNSCIELVLLISIWHNSLIFAKLPGKCQESVTAVELISFTLTEVGIWGWTVNTIFKDYFKSSFLIWQMRVKENKKQKRCHHCWSTMFHPPLCGIQISPLLLTPGQHCLRTIHAQGSSVGIRNTKR